MPTKETTDAELENLIDEMVQAQKMDLVDRAALQCVASFAANRAREQAFQEGRKQGLKEMDKAWEELDITESGSPIGVKSRKRARLEIASLRYEYQQP